MAILTRDQILSAPLRTEDVEVPEWGGSVTIQELTVDQQQLIAAGVKGKADAESRANRLTFLEGVIEPAFKPADYEALTKRGAAAMQRVVGAILVLSGMTKAQQEAILGKS